MNKKFKRHIISAGVTFVGTFLMTASVLIGADGFAFSKASLAAAIIGAVITATRAVTKVIYEIGAELVSKKKV